MSDFNLISIGKGVFETIINFFTNWVNSRINSIVAIFTYLLPDFTPYIGYLSQLFDLVLNYCLFILDASFIKPQIFTYLISSLIFKISAPVIGYVIKLVVKWWHALAP